MAHSRVNTLQFIPLAMIITKYTASSSSPQLHWFCICNLNIKGLWRNSWNAAELLLNCWSKCRLDKQWQVILPHGPIYSVSSDESELVNLLLETPQFLSLSLSLWTLIIHTWLMEQIDHSLHSQVNILLFIFPWLKEWMCSQIRQKSKENHRDRQQSRKNGRKQTQRETNKARER